MSTVKDYLKSLSASDRSALLREAKEEDKQVRSALREATAAPGVHYGVPITLSEANANGIAKAVITVPGLGQITYLARMDAEGDAEPTFNVKTADAMRPGVYHDGETLALFAAAIGEHTASVTKRLTTEYRKASKRHVWVDKKTR